MLCKLAWGNVRRAGRDYLVYLLTLTLAVTVFYAFNTVSIQVDLAGIANEGLAESLGGIISGLTVFLALVMGFLMVYANNFIMKRRKKEFGLYQVLGMSRGQVARIMALETVFVSLAALVLGVLLGPCCHYQRRMRACSTRVFLRWSPEGMQDFDHYGNGRDR